MKRILLIGLTLVVAVGIAVPVAMAGGGNSDAAKACQKDGWQGLVRQDGTGFKNTGDCVSYAAQGGVLKAKPTGGAPVLTLTGNGSATSAPITTAQTVVYAGKYTNGAAPVPGATVGLTVFHGYDCLIGQDFYTDASYTTTDASGNYSKESGTPPGAGLYSARTNVGSNDHSNCVNIPVTEVPAVAEFATGNVDFAVELGLASGPLTGNVTFDAQGTKTNATGQLAMTNSLGYDLTGAVTCFNRIDAKTAVFSGTITDATLYATPGYFIAKVIDNGSAGDQIVVFVNEHGNADCSDPSDGSPGSDILADVTSGDLVVQ